MKNIYETSTKERTAKHGTNLLFIYLHKIRVSLKWPRKPLLKIFLNIIKTRFMFKIKDKLKISLSQKYKTGK
jgi:hypothetical protein